METPDLYGEDESAAGILRNLGKSAFHLARSELSLIRDEAKESGQRLVRHGIQAAIGAGLLVLCAFSFLAFLVIGLGDILGGRHWLGALLVGLALGGIGAALLVRAIRQIKVAGFPLTRSREKLRREKETFREALHSIREDADYRERRVS